MSWLRKIKNWFKDGSEPIAPIAQLVKPIAPIEPIKIIETPTVYYTDEYPLSVPVMVDTPKEELNVYKIMEDVMPLVKGKKAKTKKGFSTNVKREMEAGKPQKQAVAIAFSEAGEKKKGKKK